eukprot:TRINITY_DN6373_c0_g1_i1.p1 TRINITY_DN6373_c0_g1~~TRINITY_DN6373_c0_g1_i1.p1  ORF type:complete len:439 (+),score=129.21 TRINITY_DN6373_c0_g1_i1:33-1319(+)
MSTKVQWQWLDDSGWKDYDSSFSIKLEAAYRKGSKRVDVDTVRFVDLGMTNAEAISNFTNLKEKDKKFVLGVQRRKDDHTKRRAVMRMETKAVDFFNDTVFAYLPSVQGKKLKSKESDMIDAIKNAGGDVHNKLTRKVDFLIVNASEVASTWPPAKELTDAENLGIDIVSEEFITKSIMAGSQVDHTLHEVKIPTKAPTAAAGDLEGPPPGSKRSADDDEEDSSKGKGKGKAVKKTKSDLKKSDAIFSSNLVGGSEWMGVCSYPADDEYFNFTLKVDSVKGDAVLGTIEWPTLSAKTKFKGTLKGNDFTFQEYEAIAGEDEVQLPADYTGKLTDDKTIAGDLGDKASKATFKLKLTALPPPPSSSSSSSSSSSTPVDPLYLKLDTKYSGVCKSISPFLLKIDTRWVLARWGTDLPYEASRRDASFLSR